MYEKKISIFDIEDKLLINKTHQYIKLFCIIFAFALVSLVLLEKEHYYENIIEFINDDTAVIIVDKKSINMIKEREKILLGDLLSSYSINKIEESDKNYIVSINIKEKVNIYTNKYRIFLGKEKIIEYIIRILKGEL